MRRNGGLTLLLIQALILLLLPALFLLGAKHVRALGVIGPTVLCYAAGILWGNLGVGRPDEGLSMTIAEAAVPLAIPLLLFSTDFGRWLRLARKTVLSFGLMLVSVIIAAVTGALLFADRVADGWKMAPMLVGVYTGGTANLTAIGLALGVQQETFVLVNAADVVISSLYLLFLMSIAQRVLLKFLPPFQSAGAAAEEVAVTGEGLSPRGMGLGLLASAGVVGLSVGLSFLVAGQIVESLVIVSITTLGIAASFVPRIRRLPSTFEVGQYLLLTFCVAIGAMSDFTKLSATPVVLLYCGMVITTAVLLHWVLAAIFRIDVDTVIITSTAGLFSPPFVGPVAAALKNREIVVSGMTTGVMGYAVGTYLGLLLSYFLTP